MLNLSVLQTWSSRHGVPAKPMLNCHFLQVPSVIAVLKTARQQQLMEGLGQVVVPGHLPLVLPKQLLEKAVIHSSETLRIDVMQLACLHPKSTAFPGDECCASASACSCCAFPGKIYSWDADFHLLAPASRNYCSPFMQMNC